VKLYSSSVLRLELVFQAIRLCSSITLFTFLCLCGCALCIRSTIPLSGVAESTHSFFGLEE